MDFEGAFFDTSDYELTDKFIGEGSFGKVYIVNCLKDKLQYAAKIINPKNLAEGNQQMLLIRESGILNKLHHPAIVKFCGINFHSFEDDLKFQPTIITEYLQHGSIQDMIDNSKLKPDKKWTSTKRYICLLGIADAMRYLHENGIIHRDLKLQNVLLDSDYYPRVCDFGFSKCFSKQLTQSMQISMTANIGTPLYMAPELFDIDEENDDDDANHKFGPGIDVYSFSILMYELVTGKVPFVKNGKKPSLFKHVQRVQKGVRPELTDDITLKMKELLTRCWAKEPNERPSFSEIFNLLSSDLTYIKEKVDDDEVNRYLERLKMARKSESKSDSKKPSGPNEVYKLRTKLAKFLVNPTFIDNTGKLIGKGAFGSTYEQELDVGYAFEINDKNVGKISQSHEILCAVKIIPNEKARSYFIKNFMTEIEIQSFLNHIAILPLIGYSLPTNNSNFYAILTPFMKNGSLDSLLQNVARGNAPNNWETILSIIIFGIAAGMAFANQNNIIHRDLKTSNIVLDENYRPKIGSFAMADYCDKESYSTEEGTPICVAPESFTKSVFTKKSDVYAYSLILYELLTGNKPFYHIKGISPFRLYMIVKDGERPIIQKNEIPEPFEKLITTCWNDDPESRPSFAQIVKSFIDNKRKFFDFSVVDEDEFDQYVADATKDLDLSLD